MATQNERDDNEIWAISPCGCCPNCGHGDLDKTEYREPHFYHVQCWACGASWYESHWDEDDEDE
jgi:uncharacterized protein (DUF983 family)